MKIVRLMIIATAMVFTFPAQTSAREFADIYTECGLGAMIAPSNAAVAAVTNVTWDSGTTAISSNASSPDSCKGGQESAAAFILDTYATLESDLARGDGEHLRTLVHLLGCPDNTQSAVAMALRADFAEVVNESDYSDRTRYEHAERLFDTLIDRIKVSYATSCTYG